MPILVVGRKVQTSDTCFNFWNCDFFFPQFPSDQKCDLHTKSYQLKNYAWGMHIFQNPDIFGCQALGRGQKACDADIGVAGSHALSCSCLLSASDVVPSYLGHAAAFFTLFPPPFLSRLESREVGGLNSSVSK